MAIVKANYTREKEKVKTTIRDMLRKAGKDALFSFDGMWERQWAYQMIDTAEKGSIFFRFLIIPDPKTEDTHQDLYLREIAEHMMLVLEKRLENRLDKYISWVASTHNTPHRFAHIVSVIPKRKGTRKLKLPLEDLQAIRNAATENCLEQRSWRDRIREVKQGQERMAVNEA